MIIKTCKKCSQEKILDEFYVSERNKDGYQYHCKKCDNKRKTDLMRRKSIESGKTQRVYTLVARELRLQGLKVCPRCKETKTLESFYENKASHDGLASHCIICSNEMGKQRPKDEKKKSYQKNKNRVKDGHLKKRFNITLDDYNLLLEQQKGVCAICSKPEKNKRLAVDHCHASGRIRGLLCAACNMAIGMLQDNPILAIKAAEYLERDNHVIHEN